MIITIMRSGGFTGISITKTLDTTSLSLGERKEIEEIIVKIPKEQKELTSPKVTNPDRFTYTISINSGAIHRELTVREDALTPKLYKLISRIIS